MAASIPVALTFEEREALEAMAAIERRNRRDMAALLLREALERAGWLRPVQPPYKPLEGQGEDDKAKEGGAP